MPEWKNTSPGILSYGDTGFIVRYVSSERIKPWRAIASNGNFVQTTTLKLAQQDVERMYEEFKAVGLTQPESE